MSVTLEQLVAAARATASRDRRDAPEATLEARAAEAGLPGRAPGRLRAALRAPEIGIIAEVKGASPLRGVLREGLDPVALAHSYADAGAAAISVLTEERHFGGSLADLRAVAASQELPVLRKDFVVEGYQVLQAALAGAAAVLLIAEALDETQLAGLVADAHALGLDALVEVHDPRSIARAAGCGSGLIGVNNRDLATMSVDPEHALRVAAELPGDWVKVAESGFERRAQVLAAEAAGYDAVLVGTSLVRAADPGRALRVLAGEEG